MAIDTEKVDEVVSNVTTTVADAAQNVAQSVSEVAQNVKETVQDSADIPDATYESAMTQRDKGMAMLAYVLFFIPLLTGDATRSPFVKFHTNQGTVLFIASAIYSLIMGIIQSIFWAVVVAAFVANPIMGILSFSITAILSVISAVPLIFVILGIINAANGQMKKLPIIGDYTVIK